MSSNRNFIVIRGSGPVYPTLTDEERDRLYEELTKNKPTFIKIGDKVINVKDITYIGPET